MWKHRDNGCVGRRAQARPVGSWRTWFCIVSALTSWSYLRCPQLLLKLSCCRSRWRHCPVWRQCCSSYETIHRFTLVRYLNFETTVKKQGCCCDSRSYTTYDVRLSYRLLPGIAVVSTSIYLFTVSNWNLFLVPVKKLIGSPLLGTRRHNFPRGDHTA